MRVEELIKELEKLNPDTCVDIRDGHHFMRKYALERIETIPSDTYGEPGRVVLIGWEPPRHG